MRLNHGCLLLLVILTFQPCKAAGVDTLQLGGIELKSWHLKKWFASCFTDKIENRSSCGAELNVFEVPVPKAGINFDFVMTVNRIDIHITIVRDTCISYITIDGPHLRTNPATSIMWRSEKMNTPIKMTSYKDIAGARIFPDNNSLSLQKTLGKEGNLYIKTIYKNDLASFSVSTNGYRNACKTILAEEHELNSRH